MKSNKKQRNDSSTDAAYDQLQSVIVQLATRPPSGQRRDRSDEFKQLVEQALEAYRNYMRAVAI